MERRRVWRTTLIAVGLACFLGGLVIARRVDLENGWLLTAICGILIPLLFKKNLLSLLSISIIGLLLGVWRGTVYMKRLAPYSSLTKKLVTVQAVASDDAVYGDKTQLAFDVGNIQMIKPYRQQLVGTIAVQSFGESMVYRGDVVQITAKLYPTRGSHQASMNFAKLVRIQANHSWVFALRRKFAAGLQSAVPEPLGSFGLGILIGQRTTLPSDLNKDLSMVGLTHVVAVSGYNLTILVNLAYRLANKRSKYQLTILTLAMMSAFILFTGSSASIIRAAMVSTLSLAAWYFGRTIRPSILILLAAVITAGYFPPYLWSDLGWHLSFLAFIGVLIVGPQIQARFFSRKQPKLLLQLFLETTSAQLMTLPLIMYVFGSLSLIALLANMLIIPLIPLGMAVSFVAGLAGMLAAPVAGWLAWPATSILTYMLDMVHILASLPGAAVVVKISAWQLVVAYALVVAVVLMWWHKRSPNDKITDRKLFAGGA